MALQLNANFPTPSRVTGAIVVPRLHITPTDVTLQYRLEYGDEFRVLVTEQAATGSPTGNALVAAVDSNSGDFTVAGRARALALTVEEKHKSLFGLTTAPGTIGTYFS